MQTLRNGSKTRKKWIIDPYPSIAHMCGQWYHVVIRKRSCYKIKMGSGGLALVTLLGGKDRKDPLLSVLSQNVTILATQKHWTIGVFPLCI